MRKIGVIGGSGLYEIEGFVYKADVEIETPYGRPSDSYRLYEYNGMEFYFLNRHGREHGIPPHKVNYRANIDGFAQLGIENIVSFTATGGINKVFNPGDIVLSDNAIDMTSGREHTYYSEGTIYHIDLTEPFCMRLRDMVKKSAERAGIYVHDGGTYVCTNGPRLETGAEIKAFDRWGADLVGMTLFPECSLAREKEICYTNVSIITNYGAGTGKTKLTVEEVITEMTKAGEKLKRIVSCLPEIYSEERDCGCVYALTGTKISKK
ncbi:MAG: S-methyl-5'-thioadenosine phosphorylase [Deferribacterales bacterium]